ncbi:hypothetical protein GIB67_030906 [Kingdonia uniflora]|uniref:Pentatricopeptide repeat-containing protein n=1 Tax=Kingdonia uniflora TaxID=39325 RepID=A0A7J7L3J2_9MAGN|nr:hypothetical protein GIB67_030906 [Kingdonia uniflora]
MIEESSVNTTVKSLIEEACNTLDEMEAQGNVPDLKMRTTLIQGLSKAGEIDKALACLTKTQETYSDSVADLVKVLVNYLCVSSKADVACTLVSEMVEKTDIRPSRYTYAQFLQKLLGEGKLVKPLDNLLLVTKDNAPPIRKPLIDYISEKGTIEDTREFLKAMTVEQGKEILDKLPKQIRNDPEILNLFGSSESDSAADSVATAPNSDSTDDSADIDSPPSDADSAPTTAVSA